LFERRNTMVTDNLIIKNAVIINRNFEGRAEPPYNPAGSRNFTVRLPEEDAVNLAKYGWNVKIRPSSDPDEGSVGYLSVTVSFGKYPPRIIQVTEKNGKLNKVPLNETTVANIDTAEIKDVKLEIRPYNWTGRDGKSGGVKAYLKTMYFTLVEDVFAADYDDPDWTPDDLPFEVD